MSSASSDELLVYKFFAEKYKLPNKIEDAPIAFKPVRVWDWYDVDRQIIHASNWQIRYGVDHVKVENSTITDFYKKTRLNNKLIVRRYDVHTGDLYENYMYEGAYTQIKLSIDGRVKQTNICARYPALPIYFKNKLASHPNKHLICGYGIKPYGNIVAFWTSEELMRKYLYGWAMLPLDNVIDDVRIIKRIM